MSRMASVIVLSGAVWLPLAFGGPPDALTPARPPAVGQPARPNFIEPIFDDSLTSEHLKPTPETRHLPLARRVPPLPTLDLTRTIAIVDAPAELRNHRALRLADFAQLKKAAVDGYIDQLPPQFSQLHGQQVCLYGYVVVPWLAEPVTEFFLSADPWDDCCIGRPPTLFTSLSVMMASGTSLSRPTRWMVGLRGRLSISPVYEDGHLCGLITLTDAQEWTATRLPPH